jgi:hypothetical protein
MIIFLYSSYWANFKNDAIKKALSRLIARKCPSILGFRSFSKKLARCQLFLKPKKKKISPILS